MKELRRIYKAFHMNQFRSTLASMFRRSSGSGGSGPNIPKGAGAGLAALVTVIGGLGLATVGISYSLVTVEPGHQGIVYSRFSGLNSDRRLTEGLNILIPWFERAIVYDIRARPQQINSHSGSKGTALFFKSILLTSL